MTEIQNETAVVRNLRDAGCDESTIQTFLNCMREGNRKRGLKLLEEHRKALLMGVHSGEKKIDYLDYFVYQLNKAN